MLQFFCWIVEEPQDPCDPNPCGHGQCQVSGTTYSCQCDAGFMFSGTHCDPGKICATSCYVPLEDEEIEIYLKLGTS